MIHNIDNIDLWEQGNTGSESAGKTWEQIKVNSNFRIRTKELIKCTQSSKMYMSSDYNILMIWFNEDGLIISNNIATSWIRGNDIEPINFNIPSDAKLMGILIRKNDQSEITLSDIINTNIYYYDNDDSIFPSNVINSNNISNILIGELLAKKMFIGNSLIWNYIPEGFKEIEYLESDGTSWIDTRFIYKTSPRIITTILTRADEDSDLFGNQNINTTPCWIGNFKLNDSLYRWGSKDSIKVNAFPDGINTWTNWDIGQDIIVNGIILYNIDDYDFSSNLKSIYLFRGRDGNPKARCAYKKVKLYDGTILVRDFIPVREISTNKGFMYDKISKLIFRNLGTGDFILGPDKIVLPSEYTQLEYILSTGTLYIDTGVSLKSNSQIKLIATDFNSGSAFGVNTSNDQYVIAADKNIMWYRLFLESGSNGGLTAGKHTYSFLGNNGYYDGSLMHTGGTSVDSTFNLYLFARNINGNAERFGIGKINSFEIDNHTLIPCRHISSNVLGMYDTLTKTFLTNQGTGDFIAGPDK